MTIKVIRIFWLEKSKFLENLPGKNRNLSEICLEKWIFFTRIHDPQISNQIDAAVSRPTATIRTEL